MLEPREIDRWRRLTDAMLKHAAADDAAAFAQVVEILDRAQAKLPAVAMELRFPRPADVAPHYQSTSWAEIGQALGVSRSAAQQRFGAHRMTVGLHD